MKITYRMLAEVKVALDRLDGYERVIGKGESERTAPVAYDFSPDTVIKIAKIGAAIAKESDVLRTVRQQIFKQNIPEGKTYLDPVEDPAAYAKFDEDFGIALAGEAEIESPTLEPADLKLEVNRIPPSVLSFLLASGLLTGD